MILKDLLVEDYNLVFKESVLIIDGVPYMIMGFNGYKAECLNIGSQDYVKMDFQKIKELKFPNTGMVNHRGVVGYLQRIPCRRYKHGLHTENCQTLIQPGEYNDYWNSKRRDLARVCSALTSKTLYNTFMNIYPSLADALDMLQDENMQIAFDRQFAVDAEAQLIFKDVKVGHVINDHKVVLDKKFSHLELALPKGLQ